MITSNGVSVGLVPERIRERAEKLARRIKERDLEKHDLYKLALEVGSEAGLLRATLREFNRTRLVRTFFLILAFAGFTGSFITACWFAVRMLQLDGRSSNWSDFAQGADAILKIFSITLGAFTLFLWRSRLAARRKPVILQIQRLASIAQSIDEAQLDVDPDQLLRDQEQFTESSPKSDFKFTPFSMTRFLDYCVDLHALIGMCAAYLSEQAYDKEVRAEAWNLHRLTHGFRDNVGRDIQTIAQLLPRELTFNHHGKGERPSLTETPVGTVAESH